MEQAYNFITGYGFISQRLIYAVTELRFITALRLDIFFFFFKNPKRRQGEIKKQLMKPHLGI